VAARLIDMARWETSVTPIPFFSHLQTVLESRLGARDHQGRRLALEQSRFNLSRSAVCQTFDALRLDGWITRRRGVSGVIAAASSTPSWTAECSP
jgi:hypothetical protein